MQKILLAILSTIVVIWNEFRNRGNGNSKN